MEEKEKKHADARLETSAEHNAPGPRSPWAACPTGTLDVRLRACVHPLSSSYKLRGILWSLFLVHKTVFLAPLMRCNVFQGVLVLFNAFSMLFNVF